MVRLALALALILSACSNDDDGVPGDAGPRNWPAMEVPATTTPEPGILREVIHIDGVVPPANPATGDETPAEYNKTTVVRYRQDRDPPATVDAVIILYPGFLEGAGAFDSLARTLVRKGAGSGTPVEVWAIDRRSNLLEDRVALDTAEAAGNPEIANNYFFGTDTVGGQRYMGPYLPGDLPFQSEWGLATHVGDLQKIIELVPEGDRQGHVFLLGHSMGASFTEAYAAWRFEDGSRGVEELAGLILVDGILGDTPLEEVDYREGTNRGVLSVSGVDEIRAGDTYFALPIFGIDIMPKIEILGMRAALDPEGVVADEERDDALLILLSLGGLGVPPMTNAAALGFAFDDQTSALSFVAVSAGEPVGPVEEYENGLSMTTLLRPSDASTTYGWSSATADTPGELTPLAVLAESLYAGRTNLAEWYFPQRLPLDLAAVGGAAVAEDGYQAQYGLRVFDGALIDAPILAISTELVSVADYEALRARVAPTVGMGRPQAGTPRNMTLAFEVIDAGELTHLDPATAIDRPDNPVPQSILDFVSRNTGPGTVTVPRL